MKWIMVLCMLFGVAYGQTIGYLRYDSVRIEKVGGNGELILLNGSRGVTGGVLTNTGGGRTAFVAPAGSVNIYNSDGTVTANRTVDVNGHGLYFQNASQITHTTVNGTNIGNVNVNNGYVAINASKSDGSGRASDFQVSMDSISFYPFRGLLTIDTLKYATSMTNKAIMVWDSVTKHWEEISPSSIVTAAALTVGSTTIASGTSGRVLYDNGGVLGEMTNTGTGTVNVLQAAPTLTTSVTVPLVIGGTSANSSLNLTSTSSGSPGSAESVNINTNGTTQVKVTHAGNVGIGTTTPDSALTVQLGMWGKRGVRFTGLLPSANATDSMMVVDVATGGVGYRAIPSGGGTPPLTATQIAFGDGGNLMTSSSDFTWNNSSKLLSVLGDVQGNIYGIFDGDASAYAHLSALGGHTFEFTDAVDPTVAVDFNLGLIPTATIVPLDIPMVGGMLAVIGNTGSVNPGQFKLSSYGAGAATFDASGNITSVSDERLKNIQGYSNVGLAEVLKLKPINYKWNKKSGNEMDSTYTGFSAQNVKANIPNGTGINKDGYLSLQDRAILAAAVNAIKDLNAKIVKQQKEINQLKKRK